MQRQFVRHSIPEIQSPIRHLKARRASRRDKRSSSCNESHSLSTFSSFASAFSSRDSYSRTSDCHACTWLRRNASLWRTGGSEKRTHRERRHDALFQEGCCQDACLGLGQRGAGRPPGRASSRDRLLRRRLRSSCLLCGSRSLIGVGRAFRKAASLDLFIRRAPALSPLGLLADHLVLHVVGVALLVAGSGLALLWGNLLRFRLLRCTLWRHTWRQPEQ